MHPRGPPLLLAVPARGRLRFRLPHRAAALPSRTESASDMNTTSFKTFSAKPAGVPGGIEQKWYVVDAENEVVGRLAARIATILRGKHKPEYTPHVDTGDFIVVVNADKVRFTGKKETDKQYFRHTGYMGHERFTPFATMIAKHPERVIEKAVFGMLPKTTLARTQIRKKLRVFGGAEHPHTAQQPTPLTFSNLEAK